MSRAGPTFVLFPHQIHPDHPAVASAETVVIVEDFLFFRQYRFHQQKLVFHRATLRTLAAQLVDRGQTVVYLETADLPQRRSWFGALRSLGASEYHFFDPVDQYLHADVNQFRQSVDVPVHVHQSPLFLTSDQENRAFLGSKGRPFLKTYYEWQRRRFGILMDGDQPQGGQFSYDLENRRRFPRNYVQPAAYPLGASPQVAEAQRWVVDHWGTNPGRADPFGYAVDRAGALACLTTFVNERLVHFGDYEDAFDGPVTHGHHSVLTPYLNVGLLTPNEVLTKALEAYQSGVASLNNVEGFVRQILGWREFIRAMYSLHATRMRTRNFFGHQRRLEPSWWTGDHPQPIVAQLIQKALSTGYLHHIERLMVVGNYHLLSGYHPDEVYRWFMELFIDAYDWVMVPNVYGMSQYADGGLFATKPYICAANYWTTMSHYRRDGLWDQELDQLFWTFVDRHRSLFARNPRFAALLKNRPPTGGLPD